MALPPLNQTLDKFKITNSNQISPQMIQSKQQQGFGGIVSPLSQNLDKFKAKSKQQQGFGGIIGGIAGKIGSGLVNYGKSILGTDTEALKNSVQSIQSAGAGKQSVLSAGLQTAGNFTDAVFAPITNALSPLINLAGNKLAQTKTVQNIANSKVGDTIENIQNNYQQWAQKNPELSKNLEAGVKILMATIGEKPLNQGAESTLQGTKNVLESGLNKAKGITENISTKNALAADTKANAKVWDIIKPELTKSEQAQAVTEGRIVSKGKLGTITQVPKGRDLQMIEAAKPYVSNVKNSIEAVSKMQQGIAEEGTKLQQGLKDTGATYTKSQVQGALNKIEPPTMITADSTLNRAYSLVKNKMISLIGNGGNLNDLIQARKSFDAFVQKQFPNLYNSDTLTPMRSAIKDIRSTVNDVINSRLPEGNLPDGTNFKASLQKQSLLYDAIDNTASKTPKIGTNKITQFVKAHPTASKIGVGATAIGAGAAAGALGVPIVKHLLP